MAVTVCPLGYGKCRRHNNQLICYVQEVIVVKESTSKFSIKLIITSNFMHADIVLGGTVAIPFPFEHSHKQVVYLKQVRGQAHRNL